MLFHEPLGPTKKLFFSIDVYPMRDNSTASVLKNFPFLVHWFIAIL